MSYETIVKEGNFYQSATGDYGFRLLCRWRFFYSGRELAVLFKHWKTVW